MALKIENTEVERLLDEVARLAGESKTEAIRRALEERRARLVPVRPSSDRRRQVLELLHRKIWPLVPPDERGRRLSKSEEEGLLGYGTDGA